MHINFLANFFFSYFAWNSFVCASVVGVFQTLISSMKYACEILTTDEEGGPSRIPFDTFSHLYTYLAQLEGDKAEDHTETFLHSLMPLM